MYADDSRVPNIPAKFGARQVIVLEESDKPYDCDAVIETARDAGATSEDGDDEIFWVVFANEPRRLWDMTEKALRSSLKTKQTV